MVFLHSLRVVTHICLKIADILSLFFKTLNRFSFASRFTTCQSGTVKAMRATMAGVFDQKIYQVLFFTKKWKLGRKT